jgi:hypothetical protein
MIDNHDITVVVQGPVVASKDRGMDEGITELCLASVRKFLPGAHIVLSTWKGQPVEGLDYDELLLNDDPGANVTAFNENADADRSNNNRQIVSSRNGLALVKTRYAMKLRTDNYLLGEQFKILQQTFPLRCEQDKFFLERVVVNNTFTRAYGKGSKVVFHLCDFFAFGRAEDVLALWDMENLPDLEFDPSNAGSAQYYGAPNYKIDCTQKLFLRALQGFDPKINVAHLHDVSGDLIERCDRIYANNLVIAEPEIIGLGLCSKFGPQERANRLSGRLTYVNYDDWQVLYTSYCDPDYDTKPARLRLVKRNFLRFFLLLAKSAEEFGRKLKRNMRGK